MTPAIHNPFRILLVEDDDNHADLAELALEDSDPPNQICRVKDGTEAIAYLRRQPPFETALRPDIILLDLQLPRMSGHEVLSIMHEDQDISSIPTIVLSTSEADMDIRKASAKCANSYLVKPVDFGSFNEMMRDLKSYWSMWNRTRIDPVKTSS